MNQVATILNSWDGPPLSPAALHVTSSSSSCGWTCNTPSFDLVPPSQECPGAVLGAVTKMRTPRYFPFHSFLWNSQQNKPSLPVCLFTVAKPTAPQIPTPPGDQSPGRTVKKWRLSTGVPQFSSEWKANILRLTASLVIRVSWFLLFYFSSLLLALNLMSQIQDMRDFQRWEERDPAFTTRKISSSKATKKTETLCWFFLH